MPEPPKLLTDPDPDSIKPWKPIEGNEIDKPQCLQVTFNPPHILIEKG